MSGLFAYARVTPGSKPTAATELRKAAAAAGHVVLPDNTVIETVASLSTVLFARPGWRGLLDRMYEGDVLVVPALGDLGGDVKEVCASVKRLAGMGLRVYCLGLGQDRVDLASPAGQPTMEVLSAVADLEQAMKTDKERLKLEVGKPMLPSPPKGRPLSLSAAQRAEAHKLLAAGTSVVQIARQLQTSRQTIMRMRARDNAQSNSKSRSVDRRSGAQGRHRSH